MDQSTDWSPGMRVKTEVGYTAQSYCRGGSGNGTGYLIQHSRPTGHIMRDQQIIREANATEDGNKCQRRRGQLRQQTATDQFNGRCGGESELSMEGMRFGLGQVMRNWSGVVEGVRKVSGAGAGQREGNKSRTEEE